MRHGQNYRKSYIISKSDINDDLERPLKVTSATANLLSANMFGVRKLERRKKFGDIDNRPTLSCLWTDRERRRTTDIASDDSTMPRRVV